MQNADEINFYQDAQAFVADLLRENPTIATFLGDHRYDDRLGSFTQATLDNQRKLFGTWLAKFQAYSTAGWPVDAQVDLILMAQICKNIVRGFDKTRLVQRDPGTVLNECLTGVYLLILRDFAPLPDRLLRIMGRLRATPRVLNEGRQVIDIPAVPRIWAEIALDTAQQGVGLFAEYVPLLAESATTLKDDLLVVSQTAATALKEYAAWLEQTVLPQAGGDYAVGQALFDEMLREDHMVDYNAESLLTTGWQLFEDTERQMKALAVVMDPAKTVGQLLEASKQIHPSAGDLLDTYRQDMARARQFVIDHEIASIPEGESIRVEPTPAYMRPVIPYAAYMMPGFLEATQEGVFLVTPVDEDANPAEAEAKLRGHPLAEIPVTALHEAYPGHHLQLVVNNMHESLPRKISAFLSSMFVEGWAFYCEEMMEELGFVSQPVQKLGRLNGQLLRAARIFIDAALHTGKMTIDEAITFLVERSNLEPGDARAEVYRYTQTPTQPQCYLMGKLQIMEIVAEYKRRFPNATLRQMHDAILNSGSLPPRLMRMRLFG